MRRRIWIEQLHSPVNFSRFGATLFLTGLAGTNNEEITDASLTLAQGAVTLGASSVSLRTGLLAPRLATHALGSFKANLSRGFGLAATFPYDPKLKSGLASINGNLTWSDGALTDLRIATVSIRPAMPQDFKQSVGARTIGIALATFNPNASLFSRQIESIRRQSYTDWICVVSDDGSAPTFLAEMRAVLGDDPHFALVAAQTNVGFYRNFERAVAMLPDGCGWIAFADQDDEWETNKLAVLVQEAERTQAPLVFSDLAIHASDGRRLSDTFWIYRRLEEKNAAAIALANTVTGMATLVRASLLRTAMPFPALPGRAYHDRWFALSALAQGELHYINRPLARYMQHDGNHTGVLKRPPGAASLAALFLQRGASLIKGVMLRSFRQTIPAHLEFFAHWTDTELLALSLEIEALQQRLPRERWRPEIWATFSDLPRQPASVILRLPLRSLTDPYRRHILVGFALGYLFGALISRATKHRQIAKHFGGLRRGGRDHADDERR